MSSKRIKRQVEGKSSLGLLNSNLNSFLELEKDHRIAVKSQNFGKQSEIELELAELLKDGDPQKSIEYYKCALKSSKAAKDHENTILAYRNLGELCISVAEDEGIYF
jgi:tetratricopeptide (TPR) repeat protein